MEQDLKKLKQEKKDNEKNQKVVASDKATFEQDDIDFLLSGEEIDYEIEAGNWDTYILCQKNQQKTGWFYPDEDEEEKLDYILYDEEDE